MRRLGLPPARGIPATAITDIVVGGGQVRWLRQAFLSVAVSCFPGKVAPQPFATTAVLTRSSAESQYPRGSPGRLFFQGLFVGRGVWLSVATAKRGGLGRLFCPWLVCVSRCKVALGLGRSFTGITKSVLTLHSSGTGRMRALYGL